MDDETQLVPTDVTTELARAGTAALTPVAIDELTTKVVGALDLIASLIPDLRKPLPETARKVRGARTVSRDAIVSIVAMVEASPALQEMNLLSTEHAHEVLQHDDGFRVVDERLERLRAEVRYTVEARWAELVSDALAVYDMARLRLRLQKDAALAPHIATVRRHLGRTNQPKVNRKKKEPKSE